jgi:hypothetical protein
MTRFTRREFLQAATAWAGGVVLGGALPSATAEGSSQVAVPATTVGARPILKGLIEEYARLEDDPWVLTHGVRAVGRDFTIKGDSAVDFLCTRFLQRIQVAGKDYLSMPMPYQGRHTNAFLKTLLEAGVSLDHAFTLDGKRYTIGHLVDAAKALFRFDPQSIDPDDLAWSLIALSRVISPSHDTWVNAYGQQVRLSDVIRIGFDTLD